MRDLGALDFAGGTVIHVTSGMSALTCALVLGKRKRVVSEPHNAVLTMLGAALLWFGWFGFNGGSALTVGPLAAHAVATTHLAASAGAVTWVGANYLRTGKVSVLAIGLGGVAGLVAVTPAAGFVGMDAAIALGAIAGVVCSWAVERAKAWADDTLDVFGVHGVGGFLGAVGTGVLATTSVNAAGADASLHLVGVQTLSAGVAALYSAVATWGILKLVGLATDLRVHSDVEEQGLDEAQHGERAYWFK